MPDIAGRIDEMTASPVEAMVGRPLTGRIFTSNRRVRLGDASPGGRLRLDAMARFLQDVANDDTRDAGDDGGSVGWIVRRTVVDVFQFPTYLEEVTLSTWCGGVGSRWAERRTSIVGELGGHIETATIWVYVDTVTGRPAVLSPRFFEFYGEACAGRKVRANLHHNNPPDDVDGNPWPTRFCDFDVLGHMNNANYWQVVEEELARRRDLRAPMRAEIEHRDGLLPGVTPLVKVVDQDRGFDLWIETNASARIHSLAATIP